jgi:hypothetical protein
VNALTLAVLTFTLVILGFYAYDTERIANQTVESAIRPVIFRSGDLAGWNTVTFTKDSNGLFGGSYLWFVVNNHIAKDIRGYFIVNHKKYSLMFFSPGISMPPTGSSTGYRGSLSWGWMAPSSLLLGAYFDPTAFVSTTDNDGWCLIYNDIADNSYFSSESGDTTYSQQTGALTKGATDCHP